MLDARGEVKGAPSIVDRLYGKSTPERRAAETLAIQAVTDCGPYRAPIGDAPFVVLDLPFG